MAVVRVGQFVQFRRRLGANEAGDVEQVAEVLEVDDNGDSYVRLANDVDWYITDHDFRVLTPDEVLALDLEELPNVGELEELIPVNPAQPPARPWIHPAPAPVRVPYANESLQFCILYKQNEHPNTHMVCFRTREEAETEIEWFQNHNYTVLRTVRITLGYNL